MTPTRMRRVARYGLPGLALGIAALLWAALPLRAQETPVFLPVIVNPATPTPTPTSPPTATPQPTPTATWPANGTPAPTATHTATPPPGATATPTATPTATATTDPDATATATQVPASGLPLIHARPVPNLEELAEAAVFWFGELSPSSNFADVRVGYTDEGIVLYLAIFDRRLWFDETPSAATLTEWDAVTLYLSVPGAGGAEASRWRIVGQLYSESEVSPDEARSIERWNGAAWTPATLTLSTTSGWRGQQLNRDVDGRGWAQAYRIPFSALGLDSPPLGTTLRVGLVVHDRDGAGGPINAAQPWPSGLNPTNPATWGLVRIGAPRWTRPAGTQSGEVTIRRPTESDAAVPDADVGGASHNLCGGGTSFWEQWPNANYAHSTDINVQNQIDVADWPCYSRYYVTFPLESVPAGKVILSATLTMHQYSQTGAVDLAQPSLIQAARVDRNWQEESITWNNAPQVLESLPAAWVPVITSPPPWPGVARQWDVSQAVADAYAAGEPVRLALYDADDAYHSGKLFVSSDTGDWNIAGRPALHIVWGNR